MNKYIPIQFNKKLFAILLISFLLFLSIGASLNSAGEYIIAKHLGYSPIYHFWGISLVPDDVGIITTSNIVAIYTFGIFLILTTGTLAFLSLLKSTKRHLHSSKLTLKQWICIFISLFWGQQLYVGLMLLLHVLNKTIFLVQSKESIIADYYKLPTWSINIVTCTLAAIIIGYIIFKIIPVLQRFTFLIASLVGSIFTSVLLYLCKIYFL